MNPSTATVPTAPPKVASPIPGPQTVIVDNIPVHAPAAPAAPVNEDEELDKIMRDVGQEMKKEAKQLPKRHIFSFAHHQKKEAPFSIQTTKQLPTAATPVAAPPAAAAAIPIPVTTSVPVAPSVQPVAPPKVAAGPAAPVQPKTSRHVPVFVIFVACLATGFLIAAAIAAFRQ